MRGRQGFSALPLAHARMPQKSATASPSSPSPKRSKRSWLWHGHICCLKERGKIWCLSKTIIQKVQNSVDFLCRHVCIYDQILYFAPRPPGSSSFLAVVWRLHQQGDPLCCGRARILERSSASVLSSTILRTSSSWQQGMSISCSVQLLLDVATHKIRPHRFGGEGLLIRVQTATLNAQSHLWI